MKNKKKNYAVMVSMFGDYWVGRTDLPANDKNVFSDFEKAKGKVIDKFLMKHQDFDPSLEYDDEGYDQELAYAYEDLNDQTEEDCDDISKDMEKFIAL